MHAEDDAMRRMLIKEGNLTIHIEKVGHRLVYFKLSMLHMLPCLFGLRESNFPCLNVMQCRHDVKLEYSSIGCLFLWYHLFT